MTKSLNSNKCLVKGVSDLDPRLNWFYQDSLHWALSKQDVPRIVNCLTVIGKPFELFLPIDLKR